MCLLRYVGGAPTIRTFGLCVSYIFPLTRVFLADVIRLFSVWFSKQKKKSRSSFTWFKFYGTFFGLG